MSDDGGESESWSSLASTYFSDEPGKEYEIERILAQRDAQKGREFLIHWKNYALTDASWAPQSHFVLGKDEALDEWQRQLLREARGIAPKFDVEAWQAEVAQLQLEATKRREARQLERERRRHQQNLRRQSSYPSPRAQIGHIQQPHAAGETIDTRPKDGDVNLSNGRKRSRVVLSDSSDSDSPRRAEHSDASTQYSRKITLKRLKNGVKEPKLHHEQAHDGSLGSQQRATMSSREETDLPSSVARDDVGTGQSGKADAADASKDVPSRMGPRTIMEARKSVPLAGTDQRMRKKGGVMANWRAKPNSRKSRDMPGGSATLPATLQHLNNLRKRDRADRPPDIDMSLLKKITGADDTDIDTDIIRNNITPRDKPYQSPHYLSSASPTRAQRTQGSAQRPTFGLGQDPAKQSDADEQGYVTCWYWANSFSCTFGKSCPLEHRWVSRIAPEYNNLDKTHVTCPFWMEGYCAKPDDMCRFAHSLRGYVFPKPPGGFGLIKRIQPVNKPSVSSQTRRSAVDSVTLRNQHEARSDTGLSPSEKTPRFEDNSHGPLGCYYYAFGKCNKSDNACKFVHRNVRWVAEPRGKRPIDMCLESGHSHVQHTSRPISNPERVSTRTLTVPHLESRSPTPSTPSPPPTGRQLDPPIVPYSSNTASGGVECVALSPAQTEFVPDVHDVRVQLRFDLAQHADSPVSMRLMTVFLRGLDESRMQGIVKQIRQDTSLRTEHMIKSHDAQYWLCSQSELVVGGDVFTKSDDRATVDDILETLSLHSAAAIFIEASYSFLLLPARQSRMWPQLPDTDRGSTEAAFKSFIMSRPVTIPQGLSKGKMHTGTSAIDVCYLSNLKIENLKRWMDREVDPAIFLIFHPRHEAELNAVTFHLKFLDPNLTIYHSSVRGSWRWFTNHKNSGIVLFHSTFEMFHRLENLVGLTQKRFNFFQLPEPDKGGDLRRLFPDALAVYVMDDCLKDFAQDTLPAIQSLATRARITSTFVCGRPGLIEWLEDLIAAKEKSDHAVDRDRSQEKFLDLLSRFKPYVKAEAILSTPVRSPRLGLKGTDTMGELVSVDPRTIPSYAVTWEQDPLQASGMMVDWFAGWALSEISRVRRFVVLSMEKSSIRDEWMRKYQHLQVCTPFVYVKEAEEREKRKTRAKR